MAEVYSGGCQCGAVRYSFMEKPSGAHICHCRMCQKAFGGFYAALVGADSAAFSLTRGELATFKSSDLTRRGFCAQCGTPLTLSDTDGAYMSVSIGSLDHPELFPPVDQHGVEARYDFVNAMGSLPDQPPTELKDTKTAEFIKSTNHQHPDHDTKNWPSREQNQESNHE